MKHFNRDGRHLVEYEDNKERIIFKDAEKYIKEEDFSNKLPDSKVPNSVLNEENPPEEDLDKVRGINGFEKLSDDKKIKHLKEKIPDLKKVNEGVE